MGADSGCRDSRRPVASARNAAADLEILIETLRGVEKAILGFGLATPDEVRNLTAELEAGKAIPFR